MNKPWPSQLADDFFGSLGKEFDRLLLFGCFLFGLPVLVTIIVFTLKGCK